MDFSFLASLANPKKYPPSKKQVITHIGNHSRTLIGHANPPQKDWINKKSLPPMAELRINDWRTIPMYLILEIGSVYSILGIGFPLITKKLNKYIT